MAGVPNDAFTGPHNHTFQTAASNCITHTLQAASDLSLRFPNRWRAQFRDSNHYNAAKVQWEWQHNSAITNRCVLGRSRVQITAWTPPDSNWLSSELQGRGWKTTSNYVTTDFCHVLSIWVSWPEKLRKQVTLFLPWLPVTSQAGYHVYDTVWKKLCFLWGTS